MSTYADLSDSLSDGWANRETHAAFLLLTTDLGLLRTGRAALETAQLVRGPLTAEEAGEHLMGLALRFLDELLDAGLEDEYRAARDDLGSLWRVDRAELGARFLAEQDAG